MSITVEIDLVAQAAYIQLGAGEVVRTVAHDGLLNVDLDEHGLVVGIEVLGRGNSTSFAELGAAYHVHSDMLTALHSVPADVFAFLSISTGTAGGSVARNTELTPC